MEALVAAGKCRSIGLSNFNKAQLEEVVAMAKVPVSILQNECHPYLQQKDLVDVCRTHGVAFQAFSPLGSGDTNLAVGPSPTGTTPLKDPVVNAIADRAGKDAGQVILKHAIARGISVVTKSVTKARVESNFELFDWDLSPEDTKLISPRARVRGAGRESSRLEELRGRRLNVRRAFERLAELLELEKVGPPPRERVARDGLGLVVGQPPLEP